MTLQELYANIGGSYEQALRVLRIERLLDKHIRKLPQNGVIDSLVAAGDTMDAKALFESAHAAKGICGNLGLTKLAELSSQVAEEFRPGNDRRLTDEQVKETIAQIDELYQKTAEGIRQYAQA